MAKTCFDCSKCIYEIGLEDNDQYCLDGIDLNSIPDDEEHFECPNYEKG
jgi:hypothetical protein